IGLGAVCLRAARAQQSDLQVVEARRLRRPERDSIELHATGAGRPGPGSDDLPIQLRDQLDTPFPADLEGDRTLGEVGVDPDAGDVPLGQRFEPDRLPATWRGGMEDALAP